jgi:hypothetical protein
MRYKGKEPPPLAPIFCSRALALNLLVGRVPSKFHREPMKVQGPRDDRHHHHHQSSLESGGIGTSWNGRRCNVNTLVQRVAALHGPCAQTHDLLDLPSSRCRTTCHRFEATKERGPSASCQNTSKPGSPHINRVHHRVFEQEHDTVDDLFRFGSTSREDCGGVELRHHVGQTITHHLGCDSRRGYRADSNSRGTEEIGGAGRDTQYSGCGNDKSKNMIDRLGLPSTHSL